MKLFSEITRVSFPFVKPGCASWGDLSGEFRATRADTPDAYAGAMPANVVAAVLSALQREPGRPRLTWYGADAERVELSGAVLDNWVAKTANLLVEEFDIGPGTRVELDLPAHWRSIVWALATWRLGACVVTAGIGATPRNDTDLVVTHRPDAHRGATPVVAVSLPALARSFLGHLPAGAVDAAAAVMTYGDVLGWTAPDNATAAAVDGPDAHVDHAGLLAWAHASADIPDGARVLDVLPATGTHGALLPFARRTLAVLAGGGSVVAVDDPDDAGLDRIAQTERVTARVSKHPGI